MVHDGIGLGVVQLKSLGAQRLQLLYGQSGFVVFLGTVVNLVFGGNPQHTARFAHAKSFGVHDDLQGLIPRNILQTQGQCTSDSIGCDDIEVREVGNHLEQ